MTLEESILTYAILFSWLQRSVILPDAPAQASR